LKVHGCVLDAERVISKRRSEQIFNADSALKICRVEQLLQTTHLVTMSPADFFGVKHEHITKGCCRYRCIARHRCCSRTGIQKTRATGYALLGAFGISDHATFLDMLPGLALVPIGTGLAIPAMTTSILSSVARHQAGTALAVLNAARQVGGATGVAVFGAIVAHGTAASITGGVRSALQISAALLATSSAILFWSRAGTSPVETAV
jgi:hypothetical protein